MARHVAIIGDHFMLPEVFEEKLRVACGDGLQIRTRKDNWPDEPMEHGYAVSGMDGLKEYFGTADDVAAQAPPVAAGPCFLRPFQALGANATQPIAVAANVKASVHVAFGP